MGSRASTIFVEAVQILHAINRSEIMELQDGCQRLQTNFVQSGFKSALVPATLSSARPFASAIMAFHIGNKQRNGLLLWQFITTTPSHNEYLTVHSRFLD